MLSIIEAQVVLRDDFPKMENDAGTFPSILQDQDGA